MNTSVELSDSLSSIINLSVNRVNIYINIQQEADLYIPDIPISLKGGSPPETNKFIPPFVSLLIRGGIEEISKINRDNISVSLNYDQILSDSTGLLKPEITLPQNVNLISISPPWIYHIKQVSQASVFGN